MTLKRFLIEIGEQTGGKDIIISYTPTTKSWHASISNAFRYSSKDDPIAALRGAMAAYDGYRNQQQQRKDMKLDGPLEERRDHEGLSYAQLEAERNGTMSPPRACECNRRMCCLSDGLSTMKEDEDKWPKMKEGVDT